MNQEKFIKQPTIKEQYLSKVDSEGYLRLGDVSRSEFGGRQVKNIASLLDGSEEILGSATINDIIYLCQG